MHRNVFIIASLLMVLPNVTPDQCVQPGTNQLCSERGSCVAGVCKCSQSEDRREIISGAYCQCDNMSCNRHNDIICGGPQNGVCVCGECVCLPGFSGSACECSTSNTSCISPKDVRARNGKICSGRGECICGECRCNSEPYRAYGLYCERLINRS